MKTFHQCKIKYLLVTLAFFMAGCSEDDEVFTGVQVSDVVGEWYVENGIPTLEYRERTTFSIGSDGSFKVQIAYATDRNCDVEEYEGTYTISGKRMRIQHVASSQPEVLFLNKYDMRLFYPDLQMEEVDHRIVETWHMKVGEIEELLINDPDFIPVEYSSDDETVASVSPSGSVTALRPGTAYVLATSDIGSAAIRVVVELEDMPLDDYMKYLGENIEAGTKAYGSFFTDNPLEDDSGLTMRYYFLWDENVSEFAFSYNEKGSIERVTLMVRKAEILQKVINVYSEKYEYVSDTGSFLIFRSSKNARRVLVTVDYTNGIIQFAYPDDNDPFAQYDGLVVKKASEIASMVGHTITDTDKQNGYFIDLIMDSSVYQAVSVYFDPETDEVSMVRLYCKEGISYSEVDTWLSMNYVATGSESIPYAQMNPYVLISLNTTSDGDVVITYRRM
jgi:hypothetical protein